MSFNIHFYQRAEELRLQLQTLYDFIESKSIRADWCHCPNNGDFCEFHEMLDAAKQALKV
jgi:hypothetical protein